MIKIKNYNIDFNKINLCWWKDKEEAFENLCKEFFIIKYWIAEHVNLIEGYASIECPVVQWNWWLYFGFQSKLLGNTSSLNAKLADSFWDKKKMQCKMLDDDFNKIQYLVIFSNKEKTLDSEKRLQSFIKKSGVVIEFRCGKNFISELQHDDFLSITTKYFDNIDLRKAFHENNKTRWIPPTIEAIKSSWTIKNHENIFDGDYITQIEKDLAWEYQEEFLLNKRLYCDTPSLEVFSDIEQKIITTKFKWLERSLKWRAANDVEWVYEKFDSDLFSPSWEISEIDKTDILVYAPEKDHRKWLLVNLWAEWYCTIEANAERTVRFISKSTNPWIQNQ